MYPQFIEFGYDGFPSYLRFFLIINPTQTRVEIHSRIHYNRHSLLPHSWARECGFKMIKMDVKKYAMEAYGLTLDPPSYS
jgi:hypothetical protein